MENKRYRIGQADNSSKSKMARTTMGGSNPPIVVRAILLSSYI